jgi:hypothetical protein
MGKLDQVFRGFIDFKKDGKGTVKMEDLVENYIAFKKSKLNSPDFRVENGYLVILQWVEAYYRDHQELPDIGLIQQRARSEGHEDVMTLNLQISVEYPLVGANYREKLAEYEFDMKLESYQQLLTRSWKEASKGEPGCFEKALSYNHAEVAKMLRTDLQASGNEYLKSGLPDFIAWPHIAVGDVIALCGPSGVGKTNLRFFRLLYGYPPYVVLVWFPDDLRL